MKGPTDEAIDEATREGRATLDKIFDEVHASGPRCSACSAILMFIARQRGDGMCGPCSRRANGTEADADRVRAAFHQPALGRCLAEASALCWAFDGIRDAIGLGSDVTYCPPGPREIETDDEDARGTTADGPTRTAARHDRRTYE